MTKSPDKNIKNNQKKKVYSKPNILKYGSVRVLTKGVGGSAPDMGQGAPAKRGRG